MGVRLLGNCLAALLEAQGQCLSVLIPYSMESAKPSESSTKSNSHIEPSAPVAPVLLPRHPDCLLNLPHDDVLGSARHAEVTKTSLQDFRFDTRTKSQRTRKRFVP